MCGHGPDGGGGDFDAAAFSSCQGQIIRRPPLRSPPSPARNGLVPRLSSAAGGWGELGTKEKKKNTLGISFFPAVVALYHIKFSLHEFVYSRSLKVFHSLPKAALTLLASRETCCKTNTRGNRLFSFSHWEKNTFVFTFFFLAATTSYFVSFFFWKSNLLPKHLLFLHPWFLPLLPSSSSQLTWFQVCPFEAALLLEHKTEGENSCGETEATYTVPDKKSGTPQKYCKTIKDLARKVGGWRIR